VHHSEIFTFLCLACKSKVIPKLLAGVEQMLSLEDILSISEEEIVIFNTPVEEDLVNTRPPLP
jgi:hypothetical protein